MKDAIKSLEPQTRKWIAGLQKRYILEDFHLRLLVLAGQAWDRASEARRVLKKEGAIIHDRFGQKKMHPATQIEAQSMASFMRLLRETGIDCEQIPESRPPRKYGG